MSLDPSGKVLLQLLRWQADIKGHAVIADWKSTGGLYLEQIGSNGLQTFLLRFAQTQQLVGEKLCKVDIPVR